jgi:hypothetical protein
MPFASQSLTSSKATELTGSLQLERSFEGDYDIEPLMHMPSALDYDFHEPGVTPRPDLLLQVTTANGKSWTGGVRAGEPSVASAVTGALTTPNKNRLVVLARGDAYLIDVQDPTNYRALSMGCPVVAVKPVPRENVLLLATPWDATAIGPDGVLWTTGRLAIDGLRLDESQDGWIAGVADPRDLEPRDFAIDLRTGKHEGGVPFS